MYQAHREEITKLALFGEVSINQIVFGYLGYDLFESAYKHFGINHQLTTEDDKAVNFIERMRFDIDKNTIDLSFYDKETLYNIFKDDLDDKDQYKSVSYDQYNKIAAKYLDLDKLGGKYGIYDHSYATKFTVVLIMVNGILSSQATFNKICHNDIVKFAQIYGVDDNRSIQEIKDDIIELQKKWHKIASPIVKIDKTNLLLISTLL